jgi:hypothetical protein
MNTVLNLLLQLLLLLHLQQVEAEAAEEKTSFDVF